MIKKPDKQAKTGRNKNGQFAQGQSGNPAGRPRGIRYLSESLRVSLAALDGIDDKMTSADVIANVLIERAKQADLRAIEIIFNRVEGPLQRATHFYTEPSDRLHAEQELYRLMSDESIDRDEAIDLINKQRDREEREREEIRESGRRVMKNEARKREKEKREAEKKAAAVAKAQAAARTSELVFAKASNVMPSSDTDKTPWGSWERNGRPTNNQTD